MKLVEIKNWSDERLITQNEPSRNGLTAMQVEELYEKMLGVIKGDIFEEVDAIADVTVFAIGEIYKYNYDCEEVLGKGDIKDWLVNHDLRFELDRFSYIEKIIFCLGEFLDTDSADLRVQALANMVVISYNELIKIGFDPDKVMVEVMLELNSRTGEYSEETKKWQKFKTPEAQALWYTADFTNCRVL